MKGTPVDTRPRRMRDTTDMTTLEGMIMVTTEITGITKTIMKGNMEERTSVDTGTTDAGYQKTYLHRNHVRMQAPKEASQVAEGYEPSSQPWRVTWTTQTASCNAKSRVWHSVATSVQLRSQHLRICRIMTILETEGTK